MTAPAVELNVETWPIDKLIAYARNPRKIDEPVIDRMAGAIREFGFRIPIIARSDGSVVDGHLRLLAAKKLKMAHVPVALADELTDAQVKAFRLLANQSAHWVQWDDDLLKLELAELKSLDFDLSLTGFELADIDVMLADPDAEPPANDGDATDAEDVPEPPADPVTRPGDIWLLGNSHRVCCGDSTSADAVTALMGGDRVTLCVTSPPYGQQRDYGAAKAQVQNWDALMQGVFAQVMPVMTPTGQILVNLGLIHRENEWQPYWSGWIDWMRQQGWRRFGWYVWDQGHALMGDWAGRFAPCFEFVFHFNQQSRHPNKIIPKKPENIMVINGGGLRNSNGVVESRTNPEASLQTHKIPDSLIRITRHCGAIGDNISHPAVFPIALPEHLMLAYTDPGEIVYEPFGGSGTTILAGERCGRAVRAMELDPAYVDVICKRWRQAGYPPAIHAETGEEFPDDA